MSSAPHASEPLHRLSTSNASSSAASTSQQQQQPGSDPNNSLKRKRVRTGCHTCRRRSEYRFLHSPGRRRSPHERSRASLKHTSASLTRLSVAEVKCDEARPVCDDCNRLDLPCVWPEPQARSAESNEDRPIKRRKRRACTSCHADKAACSRERPICSRCRERGQACVYESTDAGSNNQDTSPSVAGDSHLSTASPAGGLARLEMQSEMATSMSVKELVELYFQKVHPLNWCSFIHRGTFMQAFQDDQVPVSLLQTMCATAVQYLPNANLSEAAKWIEDARKTVTSNMFVNPTVELLQTLVLAYVWEMGNGDALPQWMLSSLASRLAYALRLNVESNQPGLSWAQQESRRRLMWACFCVDAYVLCLPPVLQALTEIVPTRRRTGSSREGSRSLSACRSFRSRSSCQRTSATTCSTSRTRRGSSSCPTRPCRHARPPRASSLASSRKSPSASASCSACLELRSVAHLTLLAGTS